MKENFQTNNDGFILITLLASVFFIMLVGIAASQLIVNNLQVASADRYRLLAQFAADSAVDHAMQEINQDSDWPGTLSEQTLYEDSTIRTTYESVVSPGPDTFTKFLDVTGRTYTPKTIMTPKNIRKYKVELRGIGGGNYSIVTGVGGLTMRNSARIIDGNVFINGKLSLSNSAQIGLTLSPVNVEVAHQSCPNPATASYPEVCAFGEDGDPISFANSSRIYGEVKATNQQNASNMFSPGLTSACYPPTPTDCVAPISLPTHDRAAQEAAIDPANNMTGSTASCSVGLRTWQANTKITGDVNITNVCNVTIEGDVWITGDLSLRNLARIKVKEGLATSPVIMIDGDGGLLMRNSSTLLSNTDFVGTRVITYYSTAGCSPDCSEVTGVDLYNSSSITTINLDNSASGSFTEFYARWSKIEAGNSGNVGALVAQEIELSNAIAVTFGASVSDLSATVGWVIKNYKRTF